MKGINDNAKSHNRTPQHEIGHDTIHDSKPEPRAVHLSAHGKAKYNIAAPIPIRASSQSNVAPKEKPCDAPLENKAEENPLSFLEQVKQEVPTLRMLKIAGITLVAGILAIAFIAFIQALVLDMQSTAVGAISVMIGTIISGGIAYYLYKSHIKKECRERKPSMPQSGCTPEKTCMPLQLALCWCEQNAKKKKEQQANLQAENATKEPAPEEDPEPLAKSSSEDEEDQGKECERDAA